jgi:hypothetical protein
VSALDANQLVKKSTVELGPDETAEERKARLRREGRRTQREPELFFVVLVGILAVAGPCVWVVFLSQGVDPETRAFARTVLTSVLSGGVAFLFGRALARGRPGRSRLDGRGSLSSDQPQERLEPVGLGRRLVPADRGDAREAQRRARLLAGRALRRVAGDLEPRRGSTSRTGP